MAAWLWSGAPMRKRFENPPPNERHRISDVFRWKLGLLPREEPVIVDAPDAPAGWKALDPREIADPPERGWRVAWLGHASFLIQGCGVSLLVDPVFASHCGPFPLPGLFRRVAVPCAISDLPRIDAVLLTHTHYDHLDLTTLRKLGSGTPVWIAEGHAEWLRGKGFSNVSELAWNQTGEIAPGVTITSLPAHHFTARTPWDRDLGHWCGWLIEGGGCKLWHAGDSGWFPGFAEIGGRYGPIDFGMIPIGAYQPRRVMKSVHMNPEEAVRAFQEMRCRRAVGMHWGTFPLTDEPMREPVLRLGKALLERKITPQAFVAGGVGDVWIVEPLT